MKWLAASLLVTLVSLAALSPTFSQEVGNGSGGGSSGGSVSGSVAISPQPILVNVNNAPASSVPVAPAPGASSFPMACATAGSCPTPIPYPTATTGFIGTTGEDVGSAGNVYPHIVPDQWATPAPFATASAAVAYTPLQVVAGVSGQSIYPFSAFAEGSYGGSNTNDLVFWFWAPSGTACSAVSQATAYANILFRFQGGTGNSGGSSINTLTASQHSIFWGQGVGGTALQNVADGPFFFEALPIGASLCAAVQGGTSVGVQFGSHFAQR